MRYLFVALAIQSVSRLAMAEDLVPIADKELNHFYSPAHAEFAVNKDLGRAWIEQSFSGGEYEYSERYSVEGLSYDDRTQEVTYTAPESDESVVCAIKGRPTKNCLLKSVAYKKEVDDGYDIKKVPYVRVWMEVVSEKQASSDKRGPAPNPAALDPQAP